LWSKTASRRSSRASFSSCFSAFAAVSLLTAAAGFVGTANAREAIELKVRPRVCTLAAQDDLCETTVRAEWSARQDQSLCLVIEGRPEVQRCWENYSRGVYSIELAFNEDLVVELRDPQLETVLASQAVTVIREALKLRRKRHQPWNIFS
jgi:hypothetical protein